MGKANMMAETTSHLTARLYAALKHTPGCSCGECSGGLNAVDEMERRILAAEAERDEALRGLEETVEAYHARLREKSAAEAELAAYKQAFYAANVANDRAEAAEHELGTLRTLGEWAVVIISNVSEGDLTKQTDEWQTSAIQWLNEFHARRSS